MLLKVMYMANIPNAALPVLLLECLTLADEFGAPRCIDMLLTRFASLEYLELAADVNGASAVPRILGDSIPEVAASPCFNEALQTARRCLVAVTGNVPKVIRSEDLRQQFCLLNFRVVLAWTAADELQVVSENDIVFLLSTCVKAAQSEGGQGVRTEQ